MPFFKRWNNWIKIAYSISDISYGAIEMNRFTEPYIRMPEEYKQKMPFYLTYPMTNVYQTEKEYERDMERMKELYPKRMKKLLAYVEEECDKMEYEGSMMYDEYPDKVLLYKTAADVYDRAVPVQETEHGGRRRDRDLLDVIQVLLYDEMYRRRGRRRRCRRKWW